MSYIKYKFLNCRKLLHNISFLQNLNINNLKTDEDWKIKGIYNAQIEHINNTNISMLGNVDFGHVSSISLFVFKLRFTDDITNDMRIKFNERSFEIKRIINVLEMNKTLHIIALEI